MEDLCEELAIDFILCQGLGGHRLLNKIDTLLECVTFEKGIFVGSLLVCSELLFEPNPFQAPRSRVPATRGACKSLWKNVGRPAQRTPFVHELVSFVEGR